MSNPSKQSLNNTNPVPNQTFAMMPSQMPPLNSVDRMQELPDFSIGLSNPSFQVQYNAPANMFLYQDNQFSSRGYVKEEKDDGCPSGIHSNTESGSSPKTFVAYSPGSDHEKSDKLGAFADLVLGLDKGSSPLSVANISSVQEGNHPSPAGSSTGHQAVLRYQPSRDAMLSAINYSDSVILQEGPFDVNVSQLSSLDEGLIGNLGVTNTGTSSASAYDLFDGDTGQDSYMETNHDLQLSPQTFSNNPDAFNENSNLSNVNDTTTDNIGNAEEIKSTDLSKLSLDKSRIKKPVKATSPNRQGVQACFQCGKVFSNSSALAKHKLTHSDERKYVCQLCSKAFKRQDHLNGHMLTHRKKKPYECKVEGCGKSYCDARSLRRHTENHHSSTASTCISVPVSGVSVIPTTAMRGPIQLGNMAPFADNKMDTGNSFGTKVPIPTRIQYAPPSPSPYNSASAAHNTNTTSNDATSTTAAEQLQILAFQQPVNNMLSWSHQQQTQQTQQQPYLNQQVFQDSSSHSPQSDGFLLPQVSTSNTASCSPIHANRSQHSDASMMSMNERQILRMTLSQVSGIDDQNSQVAQNQGNTVQVTNQLLPSELMMTSHQQMQQLQNMPVSMSQQTQIPSQTQQRQWIGQVPFNVTPASNFTQEPKPAECPLCHRKFKNVPALNGHMRLHGGYFKRDTDPNKKAEKKSETSSHNPPLQTASISVRALIEEKIIQKRIVNPQVYPPQIGNYSDVNNQQFSMLPSDESTGPGLMPLDLNEGLSLDMQEDLMNIRQGLLSQPPIQSEKFRRHSDSDHFLAPRRPAASSVLVDIIRRKVAGKRAQRTGSDPGEVFMISQLQNATSIPHSPSTVNSPLHSPLLQPTTSVSIPNSPTTPVTAQWPHSRPMDFMFTNDVEPQIPLQIETTIPPTESSVAQQISLPSLVTTVTEPSSTSSTLTVPKIHLEREDDDDVFLNPSIIPASPMRSKKKHRPEPLFIPPHVNTTMNRFPSQLRSPRLWDPTSEGKTGSPPPYTPPPMLSPARNGSGLFWHILNSGSATPKSAPLTPRFSSVRRSNSTDGFTVEEEEISEPPETDVQPHVNIGPQYQAILPVFREHSLERFSEPERANLIWNPKVEANLLDEDVEAYLEFSCCAAVPGGGRNKEYALMILHLVDGNLQEALLRLMDSNPKLPSGHHLLTYPFTECDTWSPEDIHTYTQALNKCDKDFFSIAQELCNKTVKQCVQFYYLWKKVCPDEYKRHRLVRRKREQENLYNLRCKGVNDVDVDMESQQVSKYDAESPFSYTGRDSPANSTNDKYACEFPDCTATFVSRQALNGHVRIHGRNAGRPENGPTSSPDRDNLDTMKSYSPINNNSTSNTSSEVQEEFPCKICGKVFPKVKSRSAHMKSHRQSEAEKRTSKYD